MNKTQVTALVKKNQNSQGIENWTKNKGYGTGLKSFGIGLTVLRKLAKTIGRDHQLAATLWNSDVYDLKVISLLIDEPKKMTLQQIEKQVGELQGGMFTHVFSACGATLAKTSFAFELAKSWIDDIDRVKKICGYNLLYELSKKKKVLGMDDQWLADRITQIGETIDSQPPSVQGAMGGALLGIGKRNLQLNRIAASMAKSIGPIDCYDDPNKKCDPLDVYKHLTSDYLKEKLGF